MYALTEPLFEAATRDVSGDRQPIKVLKVVAGFGYGGTERQFVNLGLALDPACVDVHFGCMRRWGHFLPVLEQRRVPILEYPVHTFRRPGVLGAQMRLAADIRRRGIRIVHTYNFYANVFAIPAAKIAGARIVASIRDMGAYLTPAQRRLQRYVCRLADRVVVNAHAIKDWLIADGYDAARIQVIPNGIDLTRVRLTSRGDAFRQGLPVPAQAPLVGVVARITRMKGLEDFLQAAALVSIGIPAARFVVVGEGFTTRGEAIVRDDAYAGELKTLVTQLGLEQRVVFAGFREDVERILPALQVSVLPSLSEGLSNTLLESMAAAVPVVATRVGGTTEIVRDGETGLLVPPQDPASLADAIGRLLTCPALARRLGLAGRRLVADRFSMDRLVEATTTLYASLLRSVS